MPVQLLVNTAALNCMLATVTDTSDGSTGDEAGIENIMGGTGRHLRHVSGSTGDRRYVYINKAGGLSCDYVVIVNADRHSTHGVTIRSWSSYPASSTVEFSQSNFIPIPLAGPTSRDWYRAQPISNKQALGIDLTAGALGAYTKTVNQIFFSSKFTLSKPDRPQRKILATPSNVSFGTKKYEVQEQIALPVADLRLSEIQTLERFRRLREEPVFVLDESGVIFPEILLHCLVTSIQVTGVHNDICNAVFNLMVLRYWR
jgi:hypothetical protein